MLRSVGLVYAAEGEAQVVKEGVAPHKAGPLSSTYLEVHVLSSFTFHPDSTETLTYGDVMEGFDPSSMPSPR